MHGELSLASVECCQIEVSVSGRSLVQRSLTMCGVSECDREALKMRRSWLTRGCCAVEKEGGGTLLNNLVNNELERTLNMVVMVLVVR